MNEKPRKPVTLTGRKPSQKELDAAQPRLTMAEIKPRPAREPGNERVRDFSSDRQPYSDRSPHSERPSFSDRQPDFNTRTRVVGSDKPREYNQGERPKRYTGDNDRGAEKTREVGVYRARANTLAQRDDGIIPRKNYSENSGRSSTYRTPAPAADAVDTADSQRRSRLFRLNMQTPARRPRESEVVGANGTNEETSVINTNASVATDSDARAVQKPVNAQRTDETRIYGINACRAVFSKRPDAIVRMYVAQNRLPQFTDMMKYCAEKRLAYHVIPEDELINASGSEHHEGICMLIKRRSVTQLEEFLAQLPDDQPCALLVLDGVGNPHNLGAIARSAAHFGIDAVLVNAGSPIHSGSTARVAEGGIEHIKLVEYSDTSLLIEALRANLITTIATSSHEADDFYTYELPKRCAIFFGEETRGLSRQMLDAADVRLAIPGTGSIESLNVSVAAGIVMAELVRHRR